VANKFWVGGSGTWDGGTLDSGFWRTATGGSTVTTAPTSADVAIFDTNSGGGTVTVVGNMTVFQLTCSAHTGTLDFASSNMTFNSTVSIAGGAVHTVKWGSGVHTFKANLNYSQTGTNLTLDVGTATLNFQPTAQGGGTFLKGAVNAHRLRLTGLAATGVFAQWTAVGTGTPSVNFLEIDNSNGGPIIFTLNGITLTVNNNFHLAGRPNAPLLLRGVGGLGTLEAASGKTGFIDWFFAYGFTFGNGITTRNGYDGMGNGSTIVPPQAAAIGAL
jgi:hypothetical protein